MKACDTFIYTEALLKSSKVVLKNDTTIINLQKKVSGNKPSIILELPNKLLTESKMRELQNKNILTVNVKETVSENGFSKSDHEKILKAFQISVKNSNTGDNDASMAEFCSILRSIDITLSYIKYGLKTFRKFVDEKMHNLESFMKDNVCYVRLKESKVCGLLTINSTSIRPELSVDKPVTRKEKRERKKSRHIDEYHQ